MLAARSKYRCFTCLITHTSYHLLGLLHKNDPPPLTHVGVISLTIEYFSTLRMTRFSNMICIFRWYCVDTVH